MCKYKILEIQSTTMRDGSTTQREKNAKEKYKISIKCKDNKKKAQHARINKWCKKIQKKLYKECKTLQ